MNSIKKGNKIKNPFPGCLKLKRDFKKNNLFKTSR